MHTYLSCLPCFFKQVIESSRLLGISEENTKQIADEIGSRLASHDMHRSPPEMARFIQEQLVLHSGKRDPYDEIKRSSNAHAMAVLGQLQAIVKRSDQPLRTAVGLSCAGNIIDFGVSSHGVDVGAEIAAILDQEEALLADSSGGLFHLEALEAALSGCKRLLFVGDNAGEIVFDRVLLETIHSLHPGIDIHFATRGKPILNDVLPEDAFACGIDTVATVVSSGVSTPGLVLSEMSEEFARLYGTFDLVLSKGQGNFEALSETDGPIFFLFITKCQVIQQEVGSRMRQIVLIKNR